jgi:uncharacterized phage infection (PIP) family protein YhgE
MTNPTMHEARFTALEYAVFEQFPHTLEAMLHPLNRANGIATENVEAIAGLRVDMAALQTSVRGDVANLKAALDLHNDSLHNQLAEATAEYRASVTGLRQEMSLRFQKADGRFEGISGDIANLQSDVTTLKGDVTTLKSDVTTLKTDVTTIKGDVTTLKDGLAAFKSEVNAKLDTLIAEIRSNRA